MSSLSKNDQAWNSLFHELDIVQHIKQAGYFEISSSVINRYREARLMTKFDYSSQLPEIFKKHQLGILPNSRGTYIISDFTIFHQFKGHHPPIVNVAFPHHIESIDYNNITSESTAINCAFIAGILSDFTGETQLYPTINGRMGSSVFNFNISTTSGSISMTVNNAQLEIDAGYEGKDAIYLIEAKNVLSDDFLVRQLYYPFRLWSGQSRKPIHPIFLTYTNGIFHLREYTFDKADDYNSIRQVKEKRYAFTGEAIDIESIRNIIRNNPCVIEPSVPFPQANSFERLINLCELLHIHGSLKRTFITDNYAFDARQTNYYTDAGRYLDVIGKQKINGDVEFFLTATGEKLFEAPIVRRTRQFIELILSHTVFKEVFKAYLLQHEMPGKDEIVSIMQSSQLYNINSEATYYRRASTIAQWVNWMLEQIKS
ncbi:hypothetical protein KDU71_14895 [Carboxylicivirga sediminis]|uniref:Uncharacterized protein n=1 Tax=Carboxylicivirga sediminis TaxID=2006564 RepID=A0A941F739_9BACT|nr:hypothetical protein [Carboxylicivirga sediminis]MBR8536860.1 hypothetical protein [Carboxylicivirga sediminis]